MAEVAAEAGVSRATLYSRFADKMELFHALATALVDEALAGAAAAWRDDAKFAANLQAILLARDLKLYRLLHGSPHGAELLSLDAELTRKHGERLNQGIVELIAARIEPIGIPGFGEFQDAEGFARFLSASAAGLKHECATEADYLLNLARLCAIAARAIEA
jgi:AcrR family transcriptional regulator